MAVLVTAIHVFLAAGKIAESQSKTWMAGTSPAIHENYGLSAAAFSASVRTRM